MEYVCCMWCVCVWLVCVRERKRRGERVLSAACIFLEMSGLLLHTVAFVLGVVAWNLGQAFLLESIL